MGWISIVVVLDWSTKAIVGYDAGIPCTWRDWLAALNMAVNGPFPDGARGRGLSLMRDNDDNEHDLHSALGYKTPRQFEREFPTSHSTPFVAA